MAAAPVHRFSSYTNGNNHRNVSLYRATSSSSSSSSSLSSSSSSKRPRSQEDMNFTIIKRLSIQEGKGDDESSVSDVNDDCIDMTSYEADVEPEVDHPAMNRFKRYPDCRGTDQEDSVLSPFPFASRRKTVDWLVDDVIRKSYRRNFKQSSVSLSVIPKDFDPTLPILGPSPLTDLKLSRNHSVGEVEELEYGETLGIDEMSDNDHSIFGLDFALYEYHHKMNKPKNINNPLIPDNSRFSGKVSHGDCFLDDDMSS